MCVRAAGSGQRSKRCQPLLPLMHLLPVLMCASGRGALQKEVLFKGAVHNIAATSASSDPLANNDYGHSRPAVHLHRGRRDSSALIPFARGFRSVVQEIVPRVMSRFAPACLCLGETPLEVGENDKHSALTLSRRACGDVLTEAEDLVCCVKLHFPGWWKGISKVQEHTQTHT